MNVHMDVLASAGFGCGLAIVMARYLIMRALGDLDDLSKRVIHISENLAALAVRIEMLAEHDLTLKEHTKKIAYFEVQRSCKDHINFFNGDHLNGKDC